MKIIFADYKIYHKGINAPTQMLVYSCLVTLSENSYWGNCVLKSTEAYSIEHIFVSSSFTTIGTSDKFKNYFDNEFLTFQQSNDGKNKSKDYENKQIGVGLVMGEGSTESSQSTWYLHLLIQIFLGSPKQKVYLHLH